MKGIKNLLAIVTFLVCDSSFAYTQSDEVIEIGSYADGHAVVKFKYATWHVCSSNGWFSLGTAADTAKRQNMLAIATSALATGKAVFISTSGCQGGEEKVQFLSIK